MRALPGFRSVLFLLFVYPCSVLLDGQITLPTATKDNSISAFTGVSIVHTGRDGTVNPGFTFGGGIDHYLARGFVSSLEVRVKLAPGTPFGENTYGGGGRLQHRLWRTELYGDFLVSYGALQLHLPLYPDYTHDGSTVYSPGGGVDFPFNNRFAARIDYQYEFWNISKMPFHPQAITFGVVYRVPFRPYRVR